MFNTEAIDLLNEVKKEIDGLTTYSVNGYNKGINDAIWMIERKIQNYNRLPNDYLESPHKKD